MIDLSTLLTKKAQISILITGGTGFFGRALLRYLQQNDYLLSGHHLYLLSRKPEKFSKDYPELVASDCITLLHGDIEEPATLPWDFQFTHILHGATDSTVGPQLSRLHRFNQILTGTKNLLELAHKTNATHFLLTSSGGVYGPQSHHKSPLDETFPEAPYIQDLNSVYSQAKRAAEHLCFIYGEEHDINITIARCFAFIGQDLPFNVHFAAGNFLRDALSHQPITIRGDGKSVRSYLDQRDLAHWLWHLLLSSNGTNIFNVGSDHAVSILELATTIRDIISPQTPIILERKSSSNSPSSVYVPSIKKIYDHHGLRPTYSLEDSIRYVANTISCHQPTPDQSVSQV